MPLTVGDKRPITATDGDAQATAKTAGLSIAPFMVLRATDTLIVVEDAVVPAQQAVARFRFSA